MAALAVIEVLEDLEAVTVVAPEALAVSAEDLEGTGPHHPRLWAVDGTGGLIAAAADAAAR